MGSQVIEVTETVPADLQGHCPLVSSLKLGWAVDCVINVDAESLKYFKILKQVQSFKKFKIRGRDEVFCMKKLMIGGAAAINNPWVEAVTNCENSSFISTFKYQST